ncbi:MAG: hypothetical protein IE933_10685 [Sphingomonadales bacterium]|nr:hypothetical protein [Sphingomonadales bacterium]MBD3775268.1 hypothetical protein [Paracoccaceae bacterium]
MTELIEANWPLLVLALLIGIAVAWFVFVATRRTRVETTSRDTLDEGAGPAARNQALIDAPAAAATAPPVAPPPVPEGLAGVGAAVAAAVEDEQLEHATSMPPSDSGTDDLTRIKGLGPKLVALLASLGVTRFDQIAGWSDADIDRIDAQLGRFEGRIRRDNWVEQARLLAADDTAGYAAKFGNLS